MQRKPLALLLFALVVLSAGSPLVKWLVERGGDTGLVQAGAISFCNVLFVGNVCAGLVTFPLAPPRAIFTELRGLSRSGWALLVASVVLAAAVPSLLFTALETTTVTNLILLVRFESVAYAFLGWLILKSAVSKGEIAGYAVIAAGVVTIVLVQGDFDLMVGDGLVVLGAVLQGLASCLEKRLMDHYSVRVHVFIRNFVSGIIFFVAALVLFGPHHFADAFGAGVWGVMTAYALVIVVGQLAWYRALGDLSPSTIANWSMLFPILGIGYAFLLLGEIPQTIQLVGGGIIFAGMLITRVGGAKPDHAPEQAERSLAAG